MEKLKEFENLCNRYAFELHEYYQLIKGGMGQAEADNKINEIWMPIKIFKRNNIELCPLTVITYLQDKIHFPVNGTFCIEVNDMARYIKK